MNRTDVHSPTNFEPADYTYVGSFDNWPEPSTFLSPAAPQRISTNFGVEEQALNYEHAEYRTARRLLQEQGAHIHFFNERGDEQCDHCGARIRYVTIYRHKSGEHIAVGDTCAAERFGCADRREFDVKRLREAAKDARERAKLMGRAAEFLAENAPEMEQWMLTPAANAVHSIFADMSRKLVKYGSLSDRQLDFARKLLREYMERERNGGRTDAEIKRDEERAAAPDVPEGRYELTGEVVSVKEHDNGFATTWKMVVKDDRGFAVWMTIPDSVDVERGTRISVTATITRSDRDAKFGFGKRPAKARVLNAAAVAA
jgi:hypothetical protein